MGSSSQCIAEGKKPQSQASDLTEAQRLFDLGCAALRDESFEDATECLSKALEIRVQHYGELAAECATAYYKYGCALFDMLQAEADPLCDTAPQTKGVTSANVEGSTAEPMDKDNEDNDDEGEEKKEEEEEGEGEGEKDEDADEGDLEDAWKMLEFARIIHEKNGTSTIETVDIITKLADLNCFKENYETCYADYARALQILKELVEPDSRILAELNFKISIAHQLDLKPKEALSYCNQAVSICEARVQRLKQELGNLPLQPVDTSASEKSVNGIVEDVHKTSEEVIDANKKIIEKPEKSPTEALSAEISEIEELLVDLREKADELKEMASAPSLMEALQAANPEAVASMKQLVSAVTGITAKEGGSSNQSVGDTRHSSGLNASSSMDATPIVQSGFDAPTLLGKSSVTATVTHLGVMGRGVKRAEPMQVTGNGGETGEPQPKKRTLENLVRGSSLGVTQVGFGGEPTESKPAS